MKWIYLLLGLLCLSGCGKETMEQVPELLPVVQEEQIEEPDDWSDMSVEDPFAIQDYFGTHTVSPAQAAPCELIWNDGNTCIFMTETEFYAFAEKLEKEYDWEMKIVGWPVEFSFRNMEAYGTPKDVFSSFLLFEQDGRMILTNQTAELELEDGFSLRVRIPVKNLTEFPDPSVPLRAGDPLELAEPYAPDFCSAGTIPVERIMLNGIDCVLLYPQGAMMYDFAHHADTGLYTLTIEKYEPMDLSFVNSVEEAILLTIQSVQTAQPEKEVLGISMTPLYLTLELQNPLSLQAYEYEGNASFVKVEYDALGFSMEETAEALGNLSLPYLTKLRAEYWPLEDLEPLRCFPTLKEVGLNNTFHRDDNGTLSDISAVAELPDLQVFCASDYQISDISPLGMCPQLTYVSLEDNAVEDVTPLGNCPDLECVKLRNNLIRDASTLTRMVSREEDGIHKLLLSNNPLEVISEMNLAEPVSGIVLDMDIRLEGTQFADQSYVWYIPD